jgi:hypothetical protein
LALPENEETHEARVKAGTEANGPLTNKNYRHGAGCRKRDTDPKGKGNKEEEEGRLVVKEGGVSREGLQESGVFPNVRIEGIGSPAAESLNAIPWPALGGEESGATRAQGMAAKCAGEKGVKAAQIPSAGGDREGGVEPQIRVKRGTGITAVEVPRKNE